MSTVFPGTPAVAAVAPAATGPPTYIRVAGWNGYQDTNHISFGTGENNGKYSVMICLGKHAVSQTSSGIPEIDAAIKGFKDKTNQITLRDFNSGATMPVVYASVTSDLYIFSVEVDQATFNFYKTSVLPAQIETITINIDLAITPMSKGSAAVPAQPAGAITVLDIATDESNVYVLVNTGQNGKTYILMKPASNTGDWNVVAITQTPPPTKIFSTHTYLWAQDDTKTKYKIPKPINMSNWMPVPENTVSITSSSSTALYGVDANGAAMKSDETLQTGWSAVTGLTGTPIKSLIGNIDQTALYGIGQNSQVTRCEGDCTTKEEVTPLDTGGYMPLNLTADPTTKQLWMTTTTSGSVGNIFNRIETPDYSSILNVINPADKARDSTVTDINKGFSQQTDVMAVNKQLTTFQSLFTNIFGSTEASLAANKKQIAELQTSVTNSADRLNSVKSMQPVIVKFVLTLCVVAFLYALLSSFGWIVHVVALVALGAGIYLSLNNDITLPNVWG
jgi:hypothetical protein